MMTREEAIVQIYGLKKYCEDMADSDESGSYVFDLDVQALDLALSALRPVTREQLEKVWMGEWINKHSAYDHKIFTCARCGKRISIQGENLNFCPKCGSAQTDKAVDILLKRLEALKDGK